MRSTPSIENLLSQISLSDKEAGVYLAVLELGDESVSPIAKRAHINRGTAYDVLRSLISKGLVARAEISKKLHYSTTGASGLEQYIESSKAEWETAHKAFSSVRTQLEALVASAGVKPRISFYEGKMGLKEVFLDQIRGNHKEILSFSVASKLEAVFGDYIKTFALQKARAGVFTRVIGPAEARVKKYLESNYSGKASKLFAVKTVPAKDFPFETELNIYGNKIALISLDPAEPVAVIIESPTLARSQRLIFELLWKRL